MKRVISNFLKSPEEIKIVEEKSPAYVSPDAYIYNATSEVVGKVATETTPEDYILSFGSPENLKKKGLVYFQFDNNDGRSQFYSHNGLNSPIYQTCWIGEFVDKSQVASRFENGDDLYRTIMLCGYKGVVILQNGALCFVQKYEENNIYRGGFVYSEKDVKNIFEKAEKEKKL